MTYKKTSKIFLVKATDFSGKPTALTFFNDDKMVLVTEISPSDLSEARIKWEQLKLIFKDVKGGMALRDIDVRDLEPIEALLKKLTAISE